MRVPVTGLAFGEVLLRHFDAREVHQFIPVLAAGVQFIQRDAHKIPGVRFVAAGAPHALVRALQGVQAETSFGLNGDVNYQRTFDGFDEPLVLSVNQSFFYTRLSNPPSPVCARSTATHTAGKEVAPRYCR